MHRVPARPMLAGLLLLTAAVVILGSLRQVQAEPVDLPTLVDDARTALGAADAAENEFSAARARLFRLEAELQLRSGTQDPAAAVPEQTEAVPAELLGESAAVTDAVVKAIEGWRPGLASWPGLSARIDFLITRLPSRGAEGVVELQVLTEALTGRVDLIAGHRAQLENLMSEVRLAVVARGETTRLVSAPDRVEARRLEVDDEFRFKSLSAGFKERGSFVPEQMLCPVDGPREFIDSWGFARSGGRRHKGVDIMASRGVPVVAPVSGRVAHRSSGLGGLSYYLDGDDGHTYYGTHMSGYGQSGWVEAGTVIGYVGDTGNARGINHLHFEIRPHGGAAVNPFPATKAACG